MKRYLVAVLIFMLAIGVFAQETNESELLTNESAEPAPQNLSLPSEPTPAPNITVPPPAVVQNETPKPVEVPKIVNFSVSNIVPKEFKLGDAQFNVQISNTGNVELADLAPVVTGKGFSLVDIVPIEALLPGQKSYVLVMGNFKEEGEISLTIRLLNKVFTQKVMVIDPNAKENEEKAKQLEEQQKALAQKNEALAILSEQVKSLKQQYNAIEDAYEEKRRANYDVSAADLEDLKTFVRDAESNLIAQNIVETNASLVIALDELASQQEKVQTAPLIEKSILQVLTDNAVLISTLVGAILATFTLFELLNKKKESLYQKIKEVKVDDDTKIVVKQKKKAKK